MKLPLAFASLFVATTAYAQAPGDDSPGEYTEGSGAPGMAAPIAPAPMPPAPRLRRWSIGLGIGGMNLAPHVAPDIGTDYSVGQLAVRYLLRRNIEIELTVGGGREKLADGSEGDREISQGVLALRYRFNPAQSWNWWLMAGMGSLAVTRTEATDDEREAAAQSTLQFGAGVEKRWERFALQLEFRAVGVKAHDGQMTKDVPVDDVGWDPDGMLPPDKAPLPPTPTSANDGMAGGQVVFSGNYYF